MAKNPHLSRELGIFQVTIAGVGIILGAGIYALMGVAAGSAGNATWLAFLISGIVALFTGLSYAELSSMFKGNAGEYDYIKAGLNRHFALFIGLSMIAAGFISSATVALGFAGYFVQLLSMPMVIAAIILIIAMSLINFIGIKETSWFNTIATLIEFGGLVLIVFLGLQHMGSVDILEMPEGFTGVFSAAALVFFAFVGFEGIVKFREETKDPEKTIPRALIYAVIITAILYVFVAIAAVSIIGWEELHASKAPLATVAAAALGNNAFLLLGIIALFSTANTALIFMVAASRMLYGMAKQQSLPRLFSRVHSKTRTPWVAIFFVMVLSIAFSFINDIGTVANLTNLFLFITFAAVNVSLIALRYKKPDMKRPFKCPVNVGSFSVIALLGFLSSIFMLGFVVLNLV